MYIKQIYNIKYDISKWVNLNIWHIFKIILYIDINILNTNS